MYEVELPPGMEERELLNILTAQREAAIGFDQDKQLNEDRARALDYYKGEHEGYVAKDLRVEGTARSKVVTTEVADFIETAMPDLMEIFGGSEDVLTFRPQSEEDEEQCKQETDHVRHVFYNENDGWQLLYNGIKDALLSKTGVWKYYWDPDPEYEEYETEADETGLMELQAMGLEITEVGEPDENGLFQVTARKMVRDGRVVVESVAPEDFAVSRHTVQLQDSDYSAHRTRATIQQLRQRGYDQEKIEQLQEEVDDEDVDFARDAAEEHYDEEDPGHDDLREVEVVEHYIRLDAEKSGDPQLYRVVTGNREQCILELEKRAQVEFSAICPFPMPHRFYGQSAADKIVPLQKWKTSITRLANDGFAFSLHQRPEIALSQVVEGKTIEQLVDNSPGKPFITKNGEGVKMHGSSADTPGMLQYLEYINTVVESRSGFTRNAQGLNPDTLHDTKGGAEILIGAAQKRVRLMARLFAETGLRDLFLGIHELLRSNATMQQTVRLRGKWVQVEPSSWRRRADMDVNIGVGSGGREQDLMAVREFSGVLKEIVAAQGGPKGPIVTMDNLHGFGDYYADRLGIRGSERFLTDPEMAEQQQGQEIDPEAQKAMAEMQAKQQEFMSKMNLEQQKAFMKEETARMKMNMEAQLKLRQQDMEAALRREDRDAANITDVRFGGRVG